MICEEIGGGKFCLLVDEARDESHKEQMLIVLRFVNKDGFIIERFFGLVHVPDTTAQTLKNAIYSVLSRNNLEVKSIRGQGYDGASNMRGQFKGLQSLISNDCPIIEEGTGSIKGDADSAFETITTFEFVFVLHLEKEIMEITDLLCQALQRQSQDICNALMLVASTKTLLQKMKDERWDDFLSLVKSFCQVRNIDIPDLSSSYFTRGARARREHSDHTLEHHYRVDIFYESINCQLMELNHRFNDSSMELLQLSANLNPKSAIDNFRANDICQLVEKFYPKDFSEQEKLVLNVQLQHYDIDVINHPDYKLLTSISDLCQWLIKTGRTSNSDLIYRVASLILILPVSTATTERYFKLSMFDQIQLSIYYPFTFFYPNYNDKNVEEVISERSNHLKESLSETLTQFYPFAGKVASELHIDCNDDGVYFVETRVDDRLENVLKKPDNKFLQRLIPVVDSSGNHQLLGSYITMVQVNFFNCGGVAVTVQHNHKIADGASHMTFLKAWASIARRDPISVNPSFVASSMFPQNPQLPSAPYIPIWSSRTKHRSKGQSADYLLYLLCLIWRCITMETQSKPSVLHIPVNIRPRCSPPLPETSIGNTLFGTFAGLNPETSDLGLASIAAQLKDAVANVTSESIEELRGEDGHVRFVEGLRNSMESFSDFGREYYLSTSMCNSGTKDADFGWGKPVWVCTGNVNEDIPIFMNRIIMVDSCSNDGIEVWVTLEKQVVDDVQCNRELLSFASLDPSPLYLKS
ncbi:hypothetical protein LXL04_034524 [Taraxacum kok-saghyz]